MTILSDWEWKIREASEWIRTRYDHIGRKTGAPLLAVVYPPEAERAVFKEWRALASTLAPALAVRTVDALAVTSEVVRRLGAETLVEAMNEPMAGSDPLSELGAMWTTAIVDAVRSAAEASGPGRPVVVLERLAALHPATAPRAVMQMLWDSEQATLQGPVVLLIPGVLRQARVYSFLGRLEELMYRGDIL